MKPPAVPEFMLRLLVPRPLRDPLLGDLAERFARTAAHGSGRSRAQLWYWGQVVACITPMIAWRIQFGRLARLTTGIVLAIVSTLFAMFLLGRFLIAIIPDPYLSEISHIGRGVPAHDAATTALAACVFMSCLFVSGTVAAKVFGAIALHVSIAPLIVLGGILILLPIPGWITEASGDEVIWLQLAWVATLLAGVATGARIDRQAARVGADGEITTSNNE